MPVKNLNGLSQQCARSHQCCASLLHPALLILTAVSIGCGQPDDPPTSESGPAAVVAAGSSDSGGSRPAQQDVDCQAVQELVARELATSSQAQLQMETWDAVFMGGTKVGSIHTVFHELEREGKAMVRVESLSKLEIRRFGQTASMQTKITSLETIDGALSAFRTETVIGPTPVVIYGKVQDRTMRMVTTSQGKSMPNQIVWDDHQGGFFALEQSLIREPMKPGQNRSLTMLIPDVAGIQIVGTTLTAQSVESAKLLEKSQPLLRIDVVTKIGGQSIDSCCWATPEGDVLKTSIPALQQVVYRTSQSRAEAKGTGDFDLGWGSIVKISTPLPDPLSMTRAEYQVSLPKKDPAKVFASGGSQRVQSMDDHSARVLVLAVRPDSPVTGAPDPAPGPGASAPNSLIQSDDERVLELSKQIAPGVSSDPWARCVALEQGVHRAIKSKHFGQGFATAADVARSLEGDCTEHAVLLAALCRAQGIPARVVLGLVYSRRDQGFAFHMWNEAWVTDRWIPLDATLGQGGIGAAYLKLVHTNLAQGAAEAAYVLQVINQLEVQVLAYEPR